ncbi:hypothetical protein QYF36_004840 [Acer negundo]|nr:hypothetical protein QYF36_004840 [Acer negundo]
MIDLRKVDGEVMGRSSTVLELLFLRKGTLVPLLLRQLGELDYVEEDIHNRRRFDIGRLLVLAHNIQSSQHHCHQNIASSSHLFADYSFISSPTIDRHYAGRSPTSTSSTSSSSSSSSQPLILYVFLFCFVFGCLFAEKVEESDGLGWFWDRIGGN